MDNKTKSLIKALRCTGNDIPDELMGGCLSKTCAYRDIGDNACDVYSMCADAANKIEQQDKKITECKDQLEIVQAQSSATRAELKRYTMGEKDKRLMFTPCAPYTTVYCINKGRVEPDEVTGFKFDGNLSFTLESTGDTHWTINRFGKTVFLSSEEATAALVALMGRKE